MPPVIVSSPNSATRLADLGASSLIASLVVLSTLLLLSIGCACCKVKKNKNSKKGPEGRAKAEDPSSMESTKEGQEGESYEYRLVGKSADSIDASKKGEALVSSKPTEEPPKQSFKTVKNGNVRESATAAQRESKPASVLPKTTRLKTLSPYSTKKAAVHYYELDHGRNTTHSSPTGRTASMADEDATAYHTMYNVSSDFCATAYSTPSESHLNLASETPVTAAGESGMYLTVGSTAHQYSTVGPPATTPAKAAVRFRTLSPKPKVRPAPGYLSVMPRADSPYGCDSMTARTRAPTVLTLMPTGKTGPTGKTTMATVAPTVKTTVVTMNQKAASGGGTTLKKATFTEATKKSPVKVVVSRFV